jgi:hypothetical protein
MTQSLRHKAAAPDAPKAKVAVVRKLSVNGFVSPAPSGSARVAAMGHRDGIDTHAETSHLGSGWRWLAVKYGRSE